MTVPADMSPKEIVNDFNENFHRVRKLIDEDSKNDPDSDPYASKYKAKEILLKMFAALKNMKNPETLFEGCKLDAILGNILLNIAVIDMDTEELTASEKGLTEAVNLLLPNAIKPEIVITMINVYNNLGILWCNRNEGEKAKVYLLQAKELYQSFKCTMSMPLIIEHILNTSETDMDIMYLEKAHTLTLYYLAQAYGSEGENFKSAMYCHLTLRRQLQYTDFDPIDWALNSATLSQYFAEQNAFFQSRHHLAAASTVLDEYEKKLQDNSSNEEEHLAKVEVFKHRSADVARCWAKYCITLMTSSKMRLMADAEEDAAISDMNSLSLEDTENICDGDIKNLIFSDLNVSAFESKVTDQYLLTYEDARKVFLFCQTWLNKAKEYYKLETLASDYTQIIQDCSHSYNCLSFFEEDDERRAKMHKRRIDMLEEIIKEINPLYYLQYCRQIWYELGEIYSDILNIKLEKMNKTKEKLKPHALKKINALCEKSIEHYDNFLNSVKDKNGVMPAVLDENLLRPVVTAYAYIGRNSMKRIAVDKNIQLMNVTKSYDSYQAVVDISESNPLAVQIMPEEVSLCQSMVNILPIKIKKLQLELISQ